MPVAPEVNYITVQDMRDEGVPTSVPDALLERRIALASRMVEAATGRLFGARTMVARVNGTGSATLYLRDPIIDVVSLGYGDTVFDVADYTVYNRHLTEGMTSPDDRSDPRIDLLGGWFPRGKQNVIVDGVFGYTDPTASNPYGKVPDLIVHVTKLLVIREMDKMGTAMGASNRFDKANRHRLTSERTRDQAYTLNPSAASTGVGGGFFTGDPEIDRILALYARPMQIASV